MQGILLASCELIAIFALALAVAYERDKHRATLVRLREAETAKDALEAKLSILGEPGPIVDQPITLEPGERSPTDIQWQGLSVSDGEWSLTYYPYNNSVDVGHKDAHIVMPRSELIQAISVLGIAKATSTSR